MLNCKAYYIATLISLFAFTGCLESRYNFDINSTLNNNPIRFLERLPGVKNAPYLGMKITANTKQVNIYKASFKEASIEKDNLLEFSGLNDSSTIARATYREVDGFVQDLYLLHYQFAYDAGGTVADASAVVFLSLRYRPMQEDPFLFCTGPGPLYWGLVSDGHISFDSVLTIQETAAQHFLKVKKSKKGSAFNLVFMPAAFPENPEATGGSFNITKIVRMEANRIGGTKPLVFDIPAIFGDSNALHFDYVTTIPLK
jgi:hypothetical protein